MENTQINLCFQRTNTTTQNKILASPDWFRFHLT